MTSTGQLIWNAPSARAAEASSIVAGGETSLIPAARAFGGAVAELEPAAAGEPSSRLLAAAVRRECAVSRRRPTERLRRAQRPSNGAHSSSSVSISSQLGSRDAVSRRKVHKSRGLNGIAQRTGDHLTLRVARDGGDVRLEANGQQSDRSLERGLGDHHLVDADQAIVELQPFLRSAARPTGRRSRRHARRHAPRRCRGRPSRKLRGSSDRRTSRPRGSRRHRTSDRRRAPHERRVPRSADRRGRRDPAPPAAAYGLRWTPLHGRRIGLGRLEDRLLLMPSSLAEHAVKAQADEQSDEREDYDYGQALVFHSLDASTNIMRETKDSNRWQRTNPPLRPIYATARRQPASALPAAPRNSRKFAKVGTHG